MLRTAWRRTGSVCSGTFADEKRLNLLAEGIKSRFDLCACLPADLGFDCDSAIRLLLSCKDHGKHVMALRIGHRPAAFLFGLLSGRAERTLAAPVIQGFFGSFHSISFRQGRYVPQMTGRQRTFHAMLLKYWAESFTGVGCGNHIAHPLFALHIEAL